MWNYGCDPKNQFFDPGFLFTPSDTFSLGRTVLPQYKTLQTDDRRHTVPKARPIVRSANNDSVDLLPIRKHARCPGEIYPEGTILFKSVVVFRDRYHERFFYRLTTVGSIASQRMLTPPLAIMRACNMCAVVCAISSIYHCPTAWTPQMLPSQLRNFSCVHFMTYFPGSISTVVSAVEQRVVTHCRQPRLTTVANTADSRRCSLNHDALTDLIATVASYVVRIQWAVTRYSTTDTLIRTLYRWLNVTLHWLVLFPNFLHLKCLTKQ